MPEGCLGLKWSDEIKDNQSYQAIPAPQFKPQSKMFKTLCFAFTVGNLDQCWHDLCYSHYQHISGRVLVIKRWKRQQSISWPASFCGKLMKPGWNLGLRDRCICSGVINHHHVAQEGPHANLHVHDAEEWLEWWWYYEVKTKFFLDGYGPVLKIFHQKWYG